MTAVESRLGSVGNVTNNIFPTENISYIFFRAAPSDPEDPPSDVTKYWWLNFDNGAPAVVWDPNILAWRY